MIKQDANSLKIHGKTFYFASLFLNPKQARLASELYACCRGLDDWVDQKATQYHITRQLQEWHQQLSQKNICAPELQAFLNLSKITKHIRLE